MGDSAGAAIVTAAMVENKRINILLHKKVNSNLLILRIIMHSGFSFASE